MTANLTLLLAIGVLFATGTYMLMERSLTRVLLGFLLLGNGANLLLLHMGGAAGEAPVIGDGVSNSAMSDPLPQALVLTAIVITFGVTAFVLAMIYRSWRLAHEDLVIDDVDDRMVARDAARSEEAAATADEESSEPDVERRPR